MSFPSPIIIVSLVWSMGPSHLEWVRVPVPMHGLGFLFNYNIKIVLFFFLHKNKNKFKFIRVLSISKMNPFLYPWGTHKVPQRKTNHTSRPSWVCRRPMRYLLSHRCPMCPADALRHFFFPCLSRKLLPAWVSETKAFSPDTHSEVAWIHRQGAWGQP